MNYKATIRKLKIGGLIPVNFSDEELKTIEIINFIKSKISDSEEYTSDKFPQSTFFKNSKGEVLMEQDDENDILWVRYIDFWEVIAVKYILKYTDI